MHLSYLKDYRYYLASALASQWINQGKKGYIQSVLYVRLDRIGDAVLSLPVLENLYRAYPAAAIDVLVNPAAAEVYDDIPYIRNRYTYRSARYEDGGDPVLPKEVMAAEYDMVADIRGDAATLGYVRSVRPNFRMDDGGLRLKYVLRHKLLRRPRDYHELAFNLRLLREYGIPLREKDVRPGFDERQVIASVREYAEGRRYAVIHPYAGWTFREWPLARYKPVVAHLRNAGLEVAVPGREGGAGRLAGAAFVPTPHLRDLYFLLKHAALFIGSDSGPLHLAAAAGIPVVGLYGPNRPEWFGPVTDRGRTLYAGIPCSPCDQRHCPYDRSRCMEAITVKDVERAVDALLGEVP